MLTDFKNHNDEELKRLYSGMHKTAGDLGIMHERRSDFDNRRDLIHECELLEMKINKFRAGLDDRAEAEAARGSPGLRRLRAHPQAEAIRQQTLSDNRGARRDAAARIQEEEMTDAATPAPAEGKKTAKKTAKKDKAKKAAKKAAPKAAANGSARAGKIPGDARITLSAAALKENPRRKGTTQHERFGVLQKFHGKTVEEYMKKGERTTLNNAVARGEAKVSKGA